MKRAITISVCLTLFITAMSQEWGHADMAVMIYDLDSCRSVAGQNEDLRMTPASVLKLVTTATALEKMGGDSRIKTVVTTDGYLDSGGVLNGNIYVRGAVDPTMESAYLSENRFFAPLLDTLVKRGVVSINGDVVVDGSILGRDAVSPKWLFEDLSTYYGVGSHGISVYDNVQKLNIRSGAVGDSVSYSVEYPVTEPEFIDHLKVVDRKIYNIQILSMPYGNDVYIDGEIGENQFHTEPLAIANPVGFMALHLKERLEDYGICVSGIGREGKATGETVIYEHLSPLLARIIKETNYRSINHYAQSLFRLLGVQDSVEGATIADAVNSVRLVWNERGIDLSSLVMFDGSGLSPMNAVSVNQIVALLNYMWRGDNKYYFVNSLPLCGKEGTVKRIFVTSPFAVRAKSGSMTGVQSFAGYIDSNGHNYSFCIIVNGFDSNRKEIRALIENTITKLICDYEDTL